VRYGFRNDVWLIKHHGERKANKIMSRKKELGLILAYSIGGSSKHEVLCPQQTGITYAHIYIYISLVYKYIYIQDIYIYIYLFIYRYGTTNQASMSAAIQAFTGFPVIAFALGPPNSSSAIRGQSRTQSSPGRTSICSS
jgi:hypothetical protein